MSGLDLELWAMDAQSCVLPALSIENHKLSVFFPFFSSFSVHLCAFIALLCYLTLRLLYVLHLLNSLCFLFFIFKSGKFNCLYPSKRNWKLRIWIVIFIHVTTFTVLVGGKYYVRKVYSLLLLV